MQIWILTEPLFRCTPWCHDMVSGIRSTLKARKTEARCLESADQIPCSEGFLLLVGSNPGWLYASIDEARKKGLHPVVLCCMPPEELPSDCSIVYSDINEAVDYLLAVLHRHGCCKPALYGINPRSLTDLSRKRRFLSNTLFPAAENDVFQNNGSLEECRSAFLTRAADYDSVLCTNSYSAIHLMRSLQNDPQASKLMVTAFGDTILSRRYLPDLITVSADYPAFGRMAIALCELLQRTQAAHVSLAVKWQIDGADNILLPPEHRELPSLPETDSDFYSDAEMQTFLGIENMLKSCDDVELKLLDALLTGKTLSELCEQCFLSESTVKYHIKKLERLCGCQSKGELLKALQSVLDTPRT